jgi:phosphoribosyl 1,2-cyclic phosphodiesterase
VGSSATHLLIDAGISGSRTIAGLRELGLELSDIDGILVTHEHADHIGGLGVLARKKGIPIYATRGTIEAITRANYCGKIDKSLFQGINADEKLNIKDLTIHPMRISHDAASPVAYRISYGKTKVAVCTDLGIYNDYTVDCLSGMDALLLEANHDVKMLQVGKYPYMLKQRILGEKGHLSNENSGRLLCRILHDKLQTIMLGHLSKENNLPELAYEAVRMEIDMGDNLYHSGDFRLQVARRDQISEIVEV